MIILDYDADRKVPIIIGRLFLVTRRASIDVHRGEVTMQAQDQEIKSSVYDSTKYLAESKECSVLRILDEALMDTSSLEVMLEQVGSSGRNM